MQGQKDFLSQTWLGHVIAQTSTIASRGQVEVFKAVSKDLKDIAVKFCLTTYLLSEESEGRRVKFQSNNIFGFRRI